LLRLTPTHIKLIADRKEYKPRVSSGDVVFGVTFFFNGKKKEMQFSG
jgi:hypothetical protein